MSYTASPPRARSSAVSYSVNSAPPPSQARQAKVYQIDFTAVASGKRIASSKRRVRWRFGFANPQALALGETGTACRGEEHDVTLVWSITSGKRLVLADGQEVHYSTSHNSIFDFSWTMRGNHVLKIVAHASPPLSQTPNFRQYDFFVDGQSFFTFPKVFRLGLAPGAVSPASSPNNQQIVAERGIRYSSSQDAYRRSTGSTNSTNIANLEAPNNPDEEEAYLQEAIRQSLQDDEVGGGKKPSAKATKSAAASSSDLLDFGSETFAAPPAPPALQSSTSAPPFAAALPPSADPFSSGTGATFAASSSTMSSMPALPPSSTTITQNPYGPPPSTAVDPWASSSAASLPPAPLPAASNGDYFSASSQTFAVPPPQSAVANGYGPPATALALTTTAQQQSSWGMPPATASLAAVPTPAAPTQSWMAPPPVATAAPSGSGMMPPQQQSYYGNGPSSYEVQTPSYAAQQQPPPPFAMVSPQAPPTTPSTIGFMSPPNPSSNDFGFGSPEPTIAVGQESAPIPPSDPALFSMTTLSGTHGGSYDAQDTTQSAGTSGTLADQAYAKLVNMETFSLVTNKNDAPRSNPFELTSSSYSSTTIGGSQSLADIQAKKSTSGTAKPIMNTPTPAPGSMVVSSTQNGSYGASYGMNPMMMGQPPVPQQPSQYGMGMPNTQGPSSYGQTPFGMPPQQPQAPYQQQPPMQQQPPGYGGAAPPLQQPPMSYAYGQGPPMSQQPPGYY